MDRVRRVTANLPVTLLLEAKAVTEAGITETLIQGLKLIKRSSAYEKSTALRGKLHLKIDLESSRERSRR